MYCNELKIIALRENYKRIVYIRTTARIKSKQAFDTFAHSFSFQTRVNKDV